MKIAFSHTKWPLFLSPYKKGPFFWAVTEWPPFSNKILYWMPLLLYSGRHMYFTFLFESPSSGETVQKTCCSNGLWKYKERNRLHQVLLFSNVVILGTNMHPVICVTSSVTSPIFHGGAKWKNLPDFCLFFLIFPLFFWFFPSFSQFYLIFSSFPQFLAIFLLSRGGGGHPNWIHHCLLPKTNVHPVILGTNLKRGKNGGGGVLFYRSTYQNYLTCFLHDVIDWRENVICVVQVVATYPKANSKIVHLTCWKWHFDFLVA